MSEKILEAKNINKYFHDPVTVKVLTDINFSVNKGDFVAVTGKSGCGKSTLLYILSTMDTDYEGELLIDGETMRQKKEAQLARVRNEKIGFVFQFHYLLNEFNVLKNVMLPGLKLNKYPAKEVEHRAMEHAVPAVGVQVRNIDVPGARRLQRRHGPEPPLTVETELGRFVDSVLPVSTPFT